MPLLCKPSSAAAHIAALAAVALLTPAAHATERTYTFTGLATVGARDGGPPVHRYTGVFTIEDDMAASTVYRNNTVMQGFTTTYSGAVLYLGITLDNGEQVQAWGGDLKVNNIQQAEPGAPVPQDFTMQAWTGGSSGTINGFTVFNMYLSFLPVAPNFTWDGLDAYFAGNAEKMLEDGTVALPASIDPALTGTALPQHLADTFFNGLFLGTNHDLTNTVNPVYTFVETTAPVPEPASLALMLAGGVVVAVAARRKQRLQPGRVRTQGLPLRGHWVATNNGRVRAHKRMALCATLLPSTEPGPLHAPVDLRTSSRRRWPVGLDLCATAERRAGAGLRGSADGCRDGGRASCRGGGAPRG